MKILAGKETADDGEVSRSRGLRVGYLEQVPRFAEGETLYSALLDRARDPDDWQAQLRARELLSELGLTLEGRWTEETLVSELSGGWQKRVALARELMSEPELLLLDEPTNHLDLDSIEWLETWMRRAELATLTVTHDRYFLDQVATRILELDRRNPTGILDIPGNYEVFLTTKTSVLEAQKSREESLTNRLRRETEWLRQGAKARTTKQQARINRAEALADEVATLSDKNRVRRAELSFGEAGTTPKKLIEAKNISKSFGKRVLFKNLNLLLAPKTRVGLLGQNGSGKSTLIRILLGETQPDQGEIKQAEALKISYFEQKRESLDPELSLLKTLCPVGEWVEERGRRIHIRSYLQKFLFTAEQAEMKVRGLSGGEQSRVLLAKLMLEPANVLVLDEPTNDLDLETLSLLEEVLVEFDGAVLIVTHDRAFLDRVSTQILAFGSDEDPLETPLSFADLSQWTDWRQERAERAKQKSQGKGSGASSSAPAGANTAKSEPARKRTYKQKIEFQGMEAAIQKAEAEVERLTEDSQLSTVVSDSRRLAEVLGLLANAHTRVEQLYARWSELGELSD
jgi:ATP-binding cassette subfamily F protein uup